MSTRYFNKVFIRKYSSLNVVDIMIFYEFAKETNKLKDKILWIWKDKSIIKLMGWMKSS